MVKVKYVNHINETLVLNRNDFLLQEGETLHNWSLDREALNGKTVTMAKGVSEKEFAIAILSEDNGLALRDALYDIAAKDIEASKPGKLYVGEWYLTGYLKATSLTHHRFKDCLARYAYTFVSDTPYWTCDHVIDLSGSVTGADLDYPHNFPHDYGSTTGRAEVNNPDIVDSHFQLIAFGPVSNPSVTIGDTTYRVDVTLAAGEQLIIDSLTDGTRKTIEKKSADGTIENVFGLRHGEQKKGCGSYVFEPIPSGISPVYWSGEFHVQLTIYERRLQRRWG